MALAGKCLTTTGEVASVIDSSMSNHLLSPFTLGGLNLSSRVVMAPMTRSRAGTRQEPNEMMVRYYRQRAGAGLIITEGTFISRQAIGWMQAPGIYTEAQAADWRVVTDAVHAHGGHIYLQLWHTGRASHSLLRDDRSPGVSSSPIRIEGGKKIRTPEGEKEYEVPRALATDELPGVVADYAAAAQRAKDAGFDGVEIHSANGYLLDQFLQSKVNHRTDGYGGSVEKRARLLLEVADAVIGVWGGERVGVRISPNGMYNDVGSPDFREQFLYAATELGRRGLGCLHVMDGLGFGFHELGKPMTLEEFRAVFPGTIIGNVGYTQSTAEDRIASGDADLIAFGRPFITNPDLVARFRHGWPLEKFDDNSHWYTFGPTGYADYPDHGQEVPEA